MDEINDALDALFAARKRLDGAIKHALEWKKVCEEQKSPASKDMTDALWDSICNARKEFEEAFNKFAKLLGFDK